MQVIDDKQFNNFRYNRRGGIDADYNGMPYTLDSDEAAQVTEPVAPFDNEAYAAALAAAEAKAAQDETKRQGQSIAGHTVSLTEENQNGIASVLQGAELAAEMGAAFFPFNFNAMTADGVKSIPFANMADFKAFALQFLAARQQFFK